MLAVFIAYQLWKFDMAVTVYINVMALVVLLLPATHGNSCGLEHCMRCDHGRCTECHYGYYGNYCTERCQGCWLGGCEQYSGRCIQCAPGYYTESCDRTCPHNCRVSYDNHRYCDRTSGYCLEGCEKSYWGPDCNNRCSDNCYSLTCDQRDGWCFHGCNDGWFGMTCNNTCPDNCHNNRCLLLTGECSEGCKHGFHGRMCDISCKNCIDEECIFNELTQMTNCTKGCKDGWTSDDCKQRCSSKCQHRTCERDGSCKTCADGYYGDNCTTVIYGMKETVHEDLAVDEEDSTPIGNVATVRGHSLTLLVLLCWAVWCYNIGKRD